MDPKILQGKYIASELTPGETIQFRDYLLENLDAPFREDRLNKLDKLIKSEEKYNRARNELKQRQYNAALEYKHLTEKWEEHGAYFKTIEKRLVKWYYKDECFFMWWSQVEAIEHTEAAKKADEIFDELIKG
ncbi:hypothetical protein [Rossellomorea aquimaris]|uniref:hypothetical protein n=1 Tax=Rossellomorea aquimaris TaxID=189382 RepID=UPI0011E8E938|nr:hypothetical protein [Rossellomorea aquimaris]TYS91921.1 hypothetical protein FZC88_07240 [Rossellomorea aquimaris]